MAMLTASFATRREAEMTVERLVQEFGIDRAAVTIATDGDQNSAGVEPAGSDSPSDRSDADGRDDAALTGAILVSADVADDETAAKVRAAFGEFDADRVTEDETSA